VTAPAPRKLLLGVDLGLLDGKSGWGLLSHQAGLPCRWVASGHDPLPAILASIERRAGDLLGVVVETPAIVYGRGAQLAARAETLLSVAEAAGYLRGCCRGLGVPAVRITPEQWRRHLCGKASASDEVIAVMVSRLLVGLPAGRLEHEHDALGAALAVAHGWQPPPPEVVRAVAIARRQRRDPRRPA
jgi:Holliday junction resolvasome RuvABC endonuclease subunit